MRRVPTTTERFLGFVMAHFEAELRECATLGARGWPGIAGIEGIPIPSARVIAVFVVAGRSGTPWRRVLKESMSGSLSDAVKAQASPVSLCLRHGIPFATTWLSPFADGIQAADEVAGTIRGFHDAASLAGEEPRDEMIREVFDRERRLAAHTEAKVSARSFSLGCIPALEELPSYYPEHLSITDLASQLEVSRLDPGWTKKYEERFDLYSDASNGEGRPALEMLDRGGDTVLLGDPGHGKSTILAAAYIRNVRDLGGVSLYARLEDVGDAAQKMETLTSGPQAVATVITAMGMMFHNAPTPETAQALRDAAVNDRGTLVVLDALDEVSTPAGRQAALEVIKLLSTLPCRVLVASRVTGYTNPLAEGAEYLVEPLKQAAIDSFVTDWFEGERPECEVRARAVTDDSSMTSIPLIVGFVCFVAEYDEVRTSAFGLYEQYIELFLERRWKPEAQRLEPGAVANQVRNAAQLAWLMSTQGHEYGQQYDFAGLAARPPVWTDRISARELADDPRAENDLIGFVRDTGLLVPHSFSPPSSASRPYRWLHRTIHEHLAGRALADQLIERPDVYDAWLLHASLRTTWAEALKHAAGRLESRGRLESTIRRLLAEGAKRTRLISPFFSQALSMLDAAGAEYCRAEILDQYHRRQDLNRIVKLDPDGASREWASLDLTQLTRTELSDLQSAAIYGMSRPDPGPKVRRRLYEVVRSAFELGGRERHLIAAQLMEEPAEGWRRYLDYFARSMPNSDFFDLSEAPDDVIEAAAEIAVASVPAPEGEWRFWQLRPSDDGRVRRALEAALPSHGPVRRFLLDFVDRQPDNTTRLSIEDAMALTGPAVPPWIAREIGTEYPGLAEPASGWARASWQLRAMHSDTAPSAPEGWDREQAHTAIDRLFESYDGNPTAAEVEDFWKGCRWLIAHHDGSRALAMMRSFYYNHIDNFAQHTWAYNAVEMARSAFRTLPWESLFDAMITIMAESGFEANWLSWLGDTFDTATPNEAVQRAGQINRWVLQNAPDATDFWLIIHPQEAGIEDAIAAETIALLSQTAPSPAAHALLDWLISRTNDRDALPRYWSEFAALADRLDPGN